MKSHVFVVNQPHSEPLRIRATRYDYTSGSGRVTLKFYLGAEKNPSAQISVGESYSVVPMDMLYDSIAESLMLPPVAGAEGYENVEFLTEPLFTEEDKVPFSSEERKQIILALVLAKEEIQKKFDTTREQQDQVNQKLDYLTNKVAELDKFNWKRLFISTLVGVAVDLSFGTYIPASLLAAFTEVLSHFGERTIKRIGGEDKGET